MRYDLSENDLKRFSEKILKPEDLTECWKWIGTKDYRGHATFSYKKEASKYFPVGANRIAFQLANGEITKQFVKAECENPLCVNPKHLFETDEQRRTDEDDANRFWKRVDKKSENECWEWQGFRDTRGYGSFSVRNRYTRAHRFSFELHNGFLDPDLEVLHSCDNPCCVNPHHLSQGTRQQNVNEAVERNRYKRTLTADDILYIRENYDRSKGLFVQTELAERFGVVPRTIGDVIKNNRRILDYVT